MSPTEGGLDPHGEARQALQTAVGDYGTKVLSNAPLLSNLFKDFLPGSPREASLLVAAAEAEVASMLEQRAAGVGPDSAVRTVAAELAESRALDPAATQWAVTEMARALGYTVSEVPPMPAAPLASPDAGATLPWPGPATAAPPAGAAPATPVSPVAPPGTGSLLPQTAPGGAPTAPPPMGSAPPPAGPPGTGPAPGMGPVPGGGGPVVWGGGPAVPPGPQPWWRRPMALIAGGTAAAVVVVVLVVVLAHGSGPGPKPTPTPPCGASCSSSASPSVGTSHSASHSPSVVRCTDLPTCIPSYVTSAAAANATGCKAVVSSSANWVDPGASQQRQCDTQGASAPEDWVEFVLFSGSGSAQSYYGTLLSSNGMNEGRGSCDSGSYVDSSSGNAVYCEGAFSHGSSSSAGRVFIIGPSGSSATPLSVIELGNGVTYSCTSASQSPVALAFTDPTQPDTTVALACSADASTTAGKLYADFHDGVLNLNG